MYDDTRGPDALAVVLGRLPLSVVRTIFKGSLNNVLIESDQIFKMLFY